MEKEFKYKETDIKGSINLIEDCKNHYVYNINVAKENDLDIIIKGIRENKCSVDIIKELPCVTADNLHSIYCAIKDVRNDVEPNEIPIFEKHFEALLVSYGFDFGKYAKQRRYCKKILDDRYSLFCDIIEKFIKFLDNSSQDTIDLILNS